MKNIGKEQIMLSLRLAGIKRGDTLLMHSSLSSIGFVEGGAEALIDAFLTVLGTEGTFAVSTLSFLFPFDVNDTPSSVGKISEALRKRPDAKRSLNSVHSIAAVGKHADYLTSGHEKCKTNCGEGTPYTMLRDIGGKIVLLGVDMNRNTTLHSIEDIMDCSYLETYEVDAPTYMKSYEGAKIRMHKFPPGHRDFLSFTPLLRRNNALVQGKIGNAVIKVIDVRKMFELGLEALKKDEMFFMCKNKQCQYCSSARAKGGTV
jgi:aminoglycoside 3-N-acetyltransferase